MKKIMFSDLYGLTQAVLDGRKTQTRRMCKEQHWAFSDLVNAKYGIFHFDIPKYEVGEVVAVAQSYKDCGYGADAPDRSPKDYRIVRGTLGESKGWNNKMFVWVDACKHRIRITNVRVERLQAITDADCMAEGVEKVKECENLYRVPIYHKSGRITYISADTPHEAYAALIDRISGKGTWERNPWVFVYDFELIK